MADPSEVPGLDEALQGFPPVPSRWIDPVSLPAWVIPEGYTGTITSVVVAPLPGQGVPAGALVLLRSGGQFTEDEQTVARLFAARAGAALSAAHLYAEQSAITRTLMQDLLPPRLHRVHGVEFAGGYRPATARERVGGDFYDVHPAGADEDSSSLVVLGDVCGKGLDAAVLTGKIRNTLQALIPMADDHQRVLRLLNDALLNSHHTRFATMVPASVRRTDHLVRLRLTATPYRWWCGRTAGSRRSGPRAPWSGRCPTSSPSPRKPFCGPARRACSTPTDSPRPGAARSATRCSARPG